MSSGSLQIQTILQQGSYVTFFFSFNDTATTEIYTLSLHGALPILHPHSQHENPHQRNRDEHLPAEPHDLVVAVPRKRRAEPQEDRKSTRLNSSHANISHDVICLKKRQHRKLHRNKPAYN